MVRNMKIFTFLITVFMTFVFFGTYAEARKQGAAGNASGMATIQIQADSIDEVQEATTRIFVEDGYKIFSQGPEQMAFQRPGDRRTDLAYGGLEGGVWERVIVDISEQAPGYYVLECNAFMLRGEYEEISSADRKVLKFFGRQYQKMLKRIKKAVEK